jgi:hypothetical protein
VRGILCKRDKGGTFSKRNARVQVCVCVCKGFPFANACHGQGEQCT